MTTLFDGLFDDAALFPPGDAPMAAAVPAHRELRTRLGDLVGPFVVPATRLDELSVHLDVGPAFGISLIVSAGDLPAATRRVEDPGLHLAAVEVPVVADAEAAAEAVRALDEVLPATVPAAIEVPRSAARDEVLDVLAGTRYRAKLRTGGVRPELFPSAAELAETLHACIARDVAFKCTAGLHHAVRHTDPATGFEHHGFLNLLLAVSAMSAGAPPQIAAEHLRDSDASRMVAALRTWPPQRCERARALFTSFGTCSVLEPVDDLVALDLLPSPDRIPA
ncbi:hypothetical protein LY71_10565 [Geodermatophilus tzadiensis]|uniref:Uncharacterized protein n=1 Tax=Geodermatophilus tzadiensis TaxID=1137988 RepID=A0A2T0TVD2_9ACTN|nr:hypothetical protein [Geodermatophilus tzadiensis]PRY49621.1 hypothetical protein LY71_10565 [Geodermatophilus tzadiensis]